MPTDAASTKKALIRAGERLMAAHGIDGAELQDVVAMAGQRNRSAVVYHFGGRDGLLEAIVHQHRPGINIARNRLLDELEASGEITIRSVMNVIVQPTAAKLATPSGRDFLIILAERAMRLGSVGIAAAQVADADSALRANTLLHELLPGDDRTRRLRIGQSQLAGAALLADAARDINAKRLAVRQRDHRVRTVIDFISAGLGGTPIDRPDA
jgi:AcrR family transcriptional regulator